MNKFIFILLIFFNLFLLYFCFLEKSDYIIDISSSKNLEKEINNNKRRTGLILIYSTWCYHCKSFSKTYIKLSETYHNKLFFYAMSENTDYSKKFPEVEGYPTIYFYKNGNFTKNTGSRSFETLSKKINENYLISCNQINYKEIKNIYNDKYFNKDISRNLLIGFFKDNNSTNIYDTIASDYLINYIDSCYYCYDYVKYINNNNDNINIKENMILSFNKQKGNNTFYLDNKNPSIKKKFILYLYNNVFNSYEDINKENKLFLIKSIKNKLFVIFVYNNTEQKQNYIDISNKLYNMNSRKEKNILNFVLLDKNVKYDKFKKMKENNIYLIDKNFKRIIEFNNLDYIEEIIKKNNMRLKKEIENDIKYIFENSNILYSDNYNKFKYIFILFVGILFFYFFCIYFIKYIKTGKETIYSELIKQSNINTKIEIV